MDKHDVALLAVFANQAEGAKALDALVESLNQCRDNPDVTARLAAGEQFMRAAQSVRGTRDQAKTVLQIVAVEDYFRGATGLAQLKKAVANFRPWQ